MFALKVYTSNKTVCFIKLHSYTLAITGKGYNVDTNFSKKSYTSVKQHFISKISWYKC